MDKSLGTNLHFWRFLTPTKQIHLHLFSPSASRHPTMYDTNLVPRVSDLTALWGERGETLVWSGLVPGFSRLQTNGLREGQISGEFVSTSSTSKPSLSAFKLWTELCQLGIFSSRLKWSVNLPLRTANISCCRLFKSVEDVSCSKNIYRALLAAVEDIYGRPLRQDKLLPHLLCRPCERRLKNCISL